MSQEIDVLDNGLIRLRDFSRINRQRCERWHPQGIESWSMSDWFTALAGEVGELGNVIKKLNRERDGLVGNKESPEVLHAAIAKETADVFIYLDLLATRCGFDLTEAICAKFNEVSERNGFPERIDASK